MLHKGTLIAALQEKSGQFTHYNGSFNEQLAMYQQALETLYQNYPSSADLERALPSQDEGTTSAGARPSIEFDRWLISAAKNSYHGPVFLFGRSFTSHEQTRQWAECIEGVTTIAVDGSQLMPWRDASIPVALIQIGYFVNPHARDRQYVKDVRMDVMTPEELMASPDQEPEGPDNYPYSETRVALRRFQLEVNTLCDLMYQWAEQRQPKDPLYSPIVFFDGSLIVSFAQATYSRYRDAYIQSAKKLLATSEELRVPLIGYVDTSYARDIVTMLRRLDEKRSEPQLSDTSRRVHDALLWRGKLHWGDRTPAMICARNDVLAQYGPYRDSVAFCYLQTATTRPPTRLEFPRWLVEEGMLEPVIDAIRAETIAGNGYPYAIETADAVSVITMQDRNEFYAYFQSFVERQGIKFSYSTKSLSKNRRR